MIPLLLGEWHVRQLRQEHPDRVLPFDHYGSQTNNLKMLIAANESRTVAIAGTAGDDHSLEADYWPYQQGLLIVAQPKTRDVPLDVVLAQNEQLLDRCHPPSASAIRTNTFEADILNIYAYPPYNIGGICERAGLKTEARTWYQRTLRINPKFSKAREALARLEH